MHGTRHVGIGPGEYEEHGKMAPKINPVILVVPSLLLGASSAYLPYHIFILLRGNSMNQNCIRPYDRFPKEMGVYIYHI